MIKRLLIFLTVFTTILNVVNSKELEQIENLSVAGFIQNKGQISDDFQYYGTFQNLKLYVDNNKLTFNYYSLNDNSEMIGNVVNMNFINSNENSTVSGLSMNDYKINVIKSDNLYSDLKSYSEIKINNLYNGIDLILKIINNNPRYDFIVHPNADPNQIKIAFTGANGISLMNNEIVLNTILGNINHKNLLALQNDTKIDCNFEIINNELSFNLGEYNKSKELLIDPIVFTSYFGGTEDDQITKMKYSNGYYYITGWTLSADLPVTEGAFNLLYTTEKDVFVAKYQINGLNKKLVFCTYISGSGEDVANGIGVDETGNIYVAGYTYSDNFPKKGTLGFNYSGAADCFVTKLDKNGSNLVFGSLFGGSKEDFITDMDVNLAGNVYFIGYTNSTNLPVTGSAFQLTLKGGYDCLAGKINSSGNSWGFLTYIGGSLDDKANGMKLDLNNDDIYFAGQTNSTDMPYKPYKTTGGGWGQPLVVTDAPYDYTANGGIDAIEAQVDNTGALAICGYFGGKADDIGRAIDLKEDGSIILFGETNSFSGDSKFPVSQNAFQKTVAGGTDVFAAVFAPIIPKTQQIQLLSACTYFGGSGADRVSAVKYDKETFTIAFAGSTTSTDIPKVDESFKNLGSSDTYIAKISPPLTTLTYTNLFGGTGEDIATTMYMDSRGDVTIAGYTKTNNLSVIPKSNSSYKGGYDGFIYKSVYATLSTQYPQGGESKCLGENITIKWITEKLGTAESYSVYLFRTSDAENFIPIGTTTGTQLAWTIPSNLTPATDYKIKVVHNSGLVAESPATFTLTGPPSINSFAHSQSNTNYCENSELKLVASASGKSLTYKFYFNGTTLLASSADSVYIIPKLALSNAGKYSVHITGACNPAATSSDITIDVIAATKITKDITDMKVLKDKEVLFTVNATGTNLTYEWQRNGTKILSETKNEYKIPSASKAMEGKYKCIVKGDCGTVESFEATLTVDTTSSDVFENVTLKEDISVFQNNPEEIEIRFNNDLRYNYIEIIDNNGKIVFSLNNPENKSIKIGTSDLSSGLYLINGKSNNKNVIKKFILTK